MSDWQRRWLLGGGIGSGKSQVRRILDHAGVMTIDADRVGHEVLEPEGPAFAEVAAEWPGAVKGGRIDRSVLGAAVFNDPSQLRRLESITHPYIFGTIAARVEGIAGPVVVETPLLKSPVEGRWKLIVVDAGDQVRLARAVSRGMGELAVAAVMSAQPARGEWLARADLVIPNDGTVEELEDAVRLVVAAL